MSIFLCGEAFHSYSIYMYVLESIALGIVEGITEFLPISSTAHLLVAEKLLNFRDDAEIYTVVIQLGAILAASWFFRSTILDLARGLVHRNTASTNFMKAVLIGLIPAGIVGLIVEFTVGIPSSLTLIGWTLLLGGIALLLTERHIDTKPIDNEANVDFGSISLKRALIVGLSQCLAIIPGVSRSGATIVSGLLSGINRPTATAFSFYLSIPIMLAASGLKLITDHDEIGKVSGGSAGLLIGTTTAFVTAFVVVGWLLRYVQKHDYKPFAYYRIVVGAVILLFM